jgi:hypothetical protein
MSLNASPGIKLTPTAGKEVLSTNYINVFDFSTQDMPDLIAKEFARYGNQSLKGFLEKMGQEAPSTSDLIKWSEEGRLRFVGQGITRASNVFTLNGHAFRKNDTLILVGDGVEKKAIVSEVTTNTFTALSTETAGFGTAGNAGALPATGIQAFAYSNEYRKGTNGREESLEAQPDIYENSPIIIKEKDTVNGSDATNIGWIEVETDNGTGYLWYLKSRSQTRQRFDDYLEMGMIEGVSFEAASAAQAAGFKGTEGFFEAIEDGNVFDGLITDLTDVDEILDRLNKQGAISEYLFFNRFAQDRAIDAMLAAQNSYGVGGTSYGAFDNSEDMALNLGFTGFKLAGYELYKTQWRYLDDATARGLFTGNSKINGVMCPVGSTSVYDMIESRAVAQPFLHVKYKKSATEDRRYKVWMTGSVGNIATSDLDANEMHMLSERCLITVGRSNFVMVKGA